MFWIKNWRRHQFSSLLQFCHVASVKSSNIDLQNSLNIQQKNPSTYWHWVAIQTYFVVTLMHDHTLYTHFVFEKVHEHEYWEWVWYAYRTTVICNHSKMMYNLSHYSILSHKKTSKVSLRWGSFQNGSDMSMACQLHDICYMTCIVYCWDVGHSRMSLACLQNQSEKWSEPWCVAWRQTIL